jgi:hypothetical protein
MIRARWLCRNKVDGRSKTARRASSAATSQLVPVVNFAGATQPVASLIRQAVNS